MTATESKINMAEFAARIAAELSKTPEVAGQGLRAVVVHPEEDANRSAFIAFTATGGTTLRNCRNAKDPTLHLSIVTWPRADAGKVSFSGMSIRRYGQTWNEYNGPTFDAKVSPTRPTSQIVNAIVSRVLAEYFPYWRKMNERAERAMQGAREREARALELAAIIPGAKTKAQGREAHLRANGGDVDAEQIVYDNAGSFDVYDQDKKPSMIEVDLRSGGDACKIELSDVPFPIAKQILQLVANIRDGRAPASRHDAASLLESLAEFFEQGNPVHPGAMFDGEKTFRQIVRELIQPPAAPDPDDVPEEPATHDAVTFAADAMAASGFDVKFRGDSSFGVEIGGREFTFEASAEDKGEPCPHCDSNPHGTKTSNHHAPHDAREASR